MNNLYEYDIAISFAGEDRQIAESIAIALKNNGIAVFYDKFEEAELWGKNLYEYLYETYKDKSKYCLVILSKNYYKKKWTSLEKRAMQSRDINSKTEYILPLIIDDVELKGIIDTTGSINYRNHNSTSIAELIKKKINREQSTTKEKSHKKETMYLQKTLKDHKTWSGKYIDLILELINEPIDIPERLIDASFEVLVETSFGGAYNTIERISYEKIRDITEKYPKTVILGEPGSGKTTALRNLHAEYAFIALRNDEAKIPIFFELNTWNTAIPLTEWVKSKVIQCIGSDEKINQDKLILIFDGLNEIPNSANNNILLEIKLFIDSCQDYPLVFSSRTKDYMGSLELKKVEIKPLSLNKIKKFLNVFCPNSQNLLLPRILNKNLGLTDLIKNPYYLTLIIYLHETNSRKLPSNKGVLFSRVIQSLIRREETRSSALWNELKITPIYLKHILSNLAYEIYANNKSTTATINWTIKKIAEISPNYPSEKILDLLISTSLLVVNNEFIRFQHQNFLEYFIAVKLLDSINNIDLNNFCKVPLLASEDSYEIGQGESLPPPAKTGWEEIIIMLTGIHPDPEKLITRILKINPLLAGYCILNNDQISNEEIKSIIIKEIIYLIDNTNTSKRIKLDAATILGEIGDSRFKHHHINNNKILIPSLITIPSGNYYIGSNNEKYPDESPRHELSLFSYKIGKYPITNKEFDFFIKDNGYLNKKYWSNEGWEWRTGNINDEIKKSLANGYFSVREQCRCERERLENSRFNDSLNMDDWWNILMEQSDNIALSLLKDIYHKEWRKSHEYPTYWHDPLFNKNNQPVIVSWFEADAYCNWISEKLNRKYRLPTEAEWEVASRGNREQEYTWGDNWDYDNLNTLEGSILTTSPVGIFGEGQSCYGAYDMLGNVWEWTSSNKTNYPLKEDSCQVPIDHKLSF